MGPVNGICWILRIRTVLKLVNRNTYLWKTASYTTYAPIQPAFLACAFDAEISARMAHTGETSSTCFQLNDAPY